jgi:hypothetical protein
MWRASPLYIPILLLLTTRENFFILPVAYFSLVIITPEVPFYGSISSPVVDSQLYSVRIYVLIILE